MRKPTLSTTLVTVGIFIAQCGFLLSTANAGTPTRIQLAEAVPVVTGTTQQLSATATASSTGAAGTASMAVDGSLATRWESQFNIDPTTLTLDLGSAQDLHEVIIHWETANAETYNIEGSNDGSNWNILFSFSGGTFASRTDIASVGGNYRYVRMNGLSRPPENVYGYSIWEMEVYTFMPLIADADNDGVDDSDDSCPGTAANTPVSSNGCEIGFIGGYESPLSYPGYDLVWNDEFSGTTLDPANWTHQIGTGCPSLCGWGNNELQYYRSQNTTVEGGHLIIEAKQESFGGRNYTSSRINTQNKQSFEYGRIDIRAKLPEGQGMWPALWMLGDSLPTAGWPAAGEIDIMEMVGGSENTILGTVHWESNSGYASFGGNTTLSSGTFADEFHVFSIIWTPTSISWYLDDAATPYHVISTTPGHLSEFRAPFFFLFNIAVGGNLPGSPNASTVFPQQMTVDYVRVFQLQ